jgi:hypothetical protein
MKGMAGYKLSARTFAAMQYDVRGRCKFAIEFVQSFYQSAFRRWDRKCGAQAVGPKQCPRCGVINPPSALVCDCGYSFVALPKPVGETLSAESSFTRFDRFRGVHIFKWGAWLTVSGKRAWYEDIHGRGENI